MIAQDRIGWHHFLEGSLSPLWQQVQHDYLLFIGSRRSSLRWVSALICKLWDVAWDQWEHRNGILHETENEVTEHQLENVKVQV